MRRGEVRRGEKRREEVRRGEERRGEELILVRLKVMQQQKSSRYNVVLKVTCLLPL